MAQADQPGESPAARARLRTPGDAIALFHALLAGRAIECVASAHLDADFGVIRVEVIAEGDESAAVLPVRALLRDALQTGAIRLIVAHNHPGGDPSPSLRDMAMTRKLSLAADALEIDLVDHIVVARDASFSFRLEGLM